MQACVRLLLPARTSRARGYTQLFLLAYTWLFLLACTAPTSHAHEKTAVKLTSLGGAVSINCSSGEGELSVEHWVIPPHLKTVHAGYQDDHIQVSNDSQNVLIQNVGRDQLGEYLCHYRNHGDHVMRYSKVTIYLYESSIWVLYRRNFLLGGILGGAFFVVAVTLCLIDAFRWRAPPPLGRGASFNSPYAVHTSSTYARTAYANTAYEDDVPAGKKRLPRCDAFVAEQYENHIRESQVQLERAPPSGVGVTAM